MAAIKINIDPRENCYDIVGDIVLFFDLLESRK